MEAVGQFGPGFKFGSRFGKLKLKERKKHEEEWAKNGCSIMTDAWTDRKRKSILNMCVNCREGTTFLESKESSDEAHTARLIFEYVDKYVEHVGAQNVVQIVTDNATNNMAAKACENNDDTFYPCTWWSTYGAHTPKLVRVALRILSLTTSASGCERNWSAFVGVSLKFVVQVLIFKLCS
ncbi:hypothetical protein F511_10868 [Dorcoceras hygrometricum]|uniref:DUF659 domain-containing protein n=1 Tax=Dorcoceras hygrometricum TaxID=472368 RepID=A0A2Z7BW10_9LAMI|nr:hypothetical protein F511_10868 [Dorcoceras hygrometricum]